MGQPFRLSPPFLPNRKTRNQKIEQTVTAFLKTNEDAWTGTARALVATLGLSLSPEAMVAALDRMTTITFTRLKRKNSERPFRLQLPSIRHFRAATVREAVGDPRPATSPFP